MKRRLQLIVIVVFIVISTAVAQMPRSSFDPAPAHGARNQKGFIDWALSQINRRDIDYGARIEVMRQRMLNSTLRDAGFRVEALLIGALLLLYVCYWWECRRSTNLKVSTVRIVTACHNELQAARQHIAKLSSEYEQARRVLEERTEPAPLAAQTAGGRRQTAAVSGDQKDVVAGSTGNGQLNRDELLVENNSLKQQVRTLTIKWQEEQQRNRKLKGQ